ncbi:hypothetical protein C0J52_26417 [Blattella germanica]|nr:hypothetical protein C0J52_26417 [Blattella germanica]
MQSESLLYELLINITNLINFMHLLLQLFVVCKGSFICFVELFVVINFTRIVDNIPQDIFDQTYVGESLLIPRKLRTFSKREYEKFCKCILINCQNNK